MYLYFYTNFNKLNCFSDRSWCIGWQIRCKKPLYSITNIDWGFLLTSPYLPNPPWATVSWLWTLNPNQTIKKYRQKNTLRKSLFSLPLLKNQIYLIQKQWIFSLFKYCILNYLQYLKFYHKLWLYNPYIFATRCRTP